MHARLVWRSVCAALLLCSLPLGRGSGAGAGTDFVSRHYGYVITVPAGWTVTRGDCRPTQEFVAPDQASVLRVAVAAGTPSAIRGREQRVLAQYGTPPTHLTFGRWTLNKTAFTVLAATVHSSAGLGIVARVIAAPAHGMIYVFSGAAFPFNADHGRGVLAQIVAALHSVRLTGAPGTPNCTAGKTPSAAATPPATATPPSAPPATPARGGGGGYLPLSVTILPNPVPVGGQAKATAQTRPGAVCTAALAYDNIPNPLGALFGFSPQTADGYGFTSWGWTVDYGVRGGTVTVTCNYNGSTATASGHFNVR